MAHQHEHNHAKIPATIAKKDDGTVEIIFSLPYALVKETQDEVIKESAETTVVPGFRKGKAPLDKVAERIPQESLIQHTLSHILPHALSDTVEKHKLKIAIYPKFELIKAEPDQNWEVKAITCEMPEVDLGSYKETVSGALRAANLWTPEKGEKEAKKELTKEEKEQIVIKTLLDTVKITIPAVLLEEEVNAKLSSLLERIEKLGLNLDSYLNSIGKTPDGLRNEYKKQAEETLKFDLALGKIIDTEKITVSEADVDSAVKASQADPSAAKIASEDQKRIVRRILEKRTALDGLTSLL